MRNLSGGDLNNETALCIVNDYYQDALRLETLLNCNSTHPDDQSDECNNTTALRVVAEILRNKTCPIVSFR